MGSCASIHRKSAASSGKFRASIVHSETDNNIPNSMPSTPIKNNPPNLLLLDRPIHSQLGSVTSFSNYGSKEETFFEAQPWLESDCDDDFYSVNGDFTPSRGNTPLHGSRVGTPQRTLSPLVNRSVSVGRAPMHTGVPLQRSLSAKATVPVVDDSVADNSATDISPTGRKKMTLVDLFRDSIRENQPEELNNEAEAESESMKSSNTTSHISGTTSPSSSCKRTPTETRLSEKQNYLMSAQCCFPRLHSARGFKKALVAVPPQIAVDA